MQLLVVAAFCHSLDLDAFTAIGSIRRGAPQFLAEWFGLFCVLISYYTCLVVRTAPWRIFSLRLTL